MLISLALISLYKLVKFRWSKLTLKSRESGETPSRLVLWKLKIEKKDKKKKKQEPKEGTK